MKRGRLPHGRKDVWRRCVALWLFVVVVFVSVSSVSAQTLVILHSFTGGHKGGNPATTLLLDGQGNLYGTAISGSRGNGVAFKLTTSGKYAVVHPFHKKGGTDPLGSLIQDAWGNLYGTTQFGGRYGFGTVFELTPAGHEKVLYAFHGDADGGLPQAGLIIDAQGNLYGTTSYGGGYLQFGGVFKVDPLGNESVLYSFSGGADGAFPAAGLVMDKSGDLYGTATTGGLFGSGVIFRLDRHSRYSVLYSFTGGWDGAFPIASLIVDKKGTLYGAAANGGLYGSGDLFALDRHGNFTVLYTFMGGADGAMPFANLVMDETGTLYGTTVSGGEHGRGVIFFVDTSGNYRLLYAFSGGLDGAFPTAGLVIDGQGILYGTAVDGGKAGQGVVFALRP